MNELIQLTKKEINTKTVQTVNARDLHQFLDVNTRFNDWIGKRVKDYCFQENQDFVIVTEKKVTMSEAGNKATPVKEYYITLDMAKELAMVERNDKGREARRYFIECENKLREIVSIKDSLLLGIFKATGDIDKALAINAYETQYVKPLEVKVEKQSVYIEKAKPKVAFHDAVTQSSSTVDMGVAAKLLNFKGIGRNKLFGLLRDFKILDKYNRPYQQYVDKGWFKLVETSFVHPTTGDNLVNYKVVLFQKGLDNIYSILIKKGYESLGMISMEDDE